ncbi:protein no-on-transient A [Folsomia candida]|uniref:DUF243 domain-containing protein n=1 Tax=Folsomia candida TaxID=158441 RepID=A0A226ENX4_FOLCA|nr:protein no-on-transient A [Folsomia candida]OXA58980.1 hypothetical protein Fcan01_04298 [Folsomia candida]
MKAFIVLAALVAAVSAEPPSSAYGAPSHGASFGGFSSGGGGGFGGFSSGGGGGFGGSGGGGAGGQVYRHVYVHAAPDEAADHQSRVIRVPGGADKHVNIIFVKTPSQSSSQQTEVILPEQGEQKTLVYVLLKKGSNSADVKIRRPAASAPAKPEVYFIRYAGAGGAGGGSGGAGGFSSGGGGGFGGGSLSTAYGQ